MNEGGHGPFYVNSPGDQAHVDQRFAETLEHLRKAFLDKEASYALYIFNPNDEAHGDEMLENIKIGTVHPLVTVAFWSMLLGSVMEGMERWARLTSEEHGGPTDD